VLLELEVEVRCTFGKRTDFPRLNRARTLKCDDSETVCSIPDFDAVQLRRAIEVLEGF
jgi:hypothetical protein